MNTHTTSKQSRRISLRRISAHIVCILLTTTGAALADNSIKLQVAAKSEHNDPKGNNPQEVQSRWLEISATGFHLEKPAAVKLEWAFFGDNLDTDKVIKHGSGTETVELAQSKKADAKTKPVNFTFTPRHTRERCQRLHEVLARQQLPTLRHPSVRQRVFRTSSQSERHQCAEEERCLHGRDYIEQPLYVSKALDMTLSCCTPQTCAALAGDALWTLKSHLPRHQLLGCVSALKRHGPVAM